MRELLLKNLLRPLLERVGTMFAAYLIATGYDGDLVAQFANSLIATVAISVELLVVSILRMKSEN